MSTLFRPEALAHRLDRLQGEVVLLTPWASRALTLLLLATVSAVVVGLTSIDYARKETVRGVLVSSGGLARVYAPAPGTVVELHVAEGDRVAVGDPLVGIRHERAGAGGAGFQTLMLAALDRREAENRRWLELEDQRVAARRVALDADRVALDEQIRALQRRHTHQRELVALMRADLDDLERLHRDGAATTSALRARQRELVLEQRNEAELAQEIALLAGQREASRLQRDEVELDSARQQTERRMELHALAEQRARLEGERFTLLTAAVAGEVAALYVSPGQDIGADTPQLAILPAGGELLAELFVPTRAVGFVQPGQEARLLYDAFPYQRFGSFPGTVTGITTTIIAPEELPGPLRLTEPVYRASVRLPDQHIAARGEPLRLQAGMLLQANLILERRPLIAWLLAPFAAFWSGG